MKGNKISSFFLLLVLLLSVTNLPAFSTSQLDSDPHNLNGLSIGLIGVAFADDDDDEDEDDDDDNEKDKKEKKDKEEKKEQKSGKQKIKVEIEDGKAEIEIKINGIESELKLESTDLDDILSTIQSITGLSESEIKDIWEIKIEDDDDDEEEDEDDHGKKDKITICHIPPGNPGNAHTISVSGNAKNAHLAHGDTLGECPDNDDNQDDDDQINTTTITLTKQVTNDNQGTAGPNDFKISVNGTIVLSGSTTKVAPNVLFAINETVANGYEFVNITGDPKCPTKLDAKTISLAPGQDISCVIHNNDVGDATTITLTKQVTNDNQGTAGPNDFKISVNGTIVLSGSTTKVAPNVLFAINETVANGYEFVNITGDPKCPTKLDAKTISLAPGQDISCVIHNNDVGDATTITLTKQVTNDNQGTAGPNDFKISVNGTIVLSGSTTKVAPNVLFAINETVANGYEFVNITGDPKCPTKLDAKTISLAPGQDISCVIHNNDVGQASTTTDNNELSQLIEDNKKLREDLERQEEQIDELNEQVDYLSEIIASIQGFLDRIFG